MRMNVGNDETYARNDTVSTYRNAFNLHRLTFSSLPFGIRS